MKLYELHRLGRNELTEVYYNLSSWKWDYRLGVKPDGWDDMPNWDDNVSVLSKRLYVMPILQEIISLVGRKYLYKYLHLNVLGKTAFEFELWWIKGKFRRLFNKNYV